MFIIVPASYKFRLSTILLSLFMFLLIIFMFIIIRFLHVHAEKIKFMFNFIISYLFILYLQLFYHGFKV